MRHGLYDPEAGYYAAGRVRFGHGADFWTFPTRLAPAFGQLLAEHLAGLRARLVDAGDLAADAPFDVVELGAGTGALARDIVRAAQAMAQAPEPYAGLARTLRYRIGERAPALRQAQATLLAGLPVTHLPQTADDATAALEPMVGVILHNELLDVWPHTLLRPSTGERLRLGATPAGQGEAIPREALVPAMRAAFAAGEAAPALAVQAHWSSEPMPEDPYLAALTPVLARREAGGRGPAELLYAPEIPAFARWAAASLRAGWMLTIDYGADVTHGLDPAPALAQLRLFPQPATPPLRAPASAALRDLDWPGRQDVTVDIDFSHLAFAGEQAGLWPVLHGPQGLLAPGGSLGDVLGTVRCDLLAAETRRAVEAQLRADSGISVIEAARLVYDAARGFVRGSAGFRLLLQEREGTRGSLRAALQDAPDAFPVRVQALPQPRAGVSAEDLAAALGPHVESFASAPLRTEGSVVCAVDEAGMRIVLPALLETLAPLLEEGPWTSR
jgi:SAM-dependent MidA family methyltransferase